MADYLPLIDSVAMATWHLPRRRAGLACGATYRLLLGCAFCVLLWPLAKSFTAWPPGSILLWSLTGQPRTGATLVIRTPAIFVQGGTAGTVGSLVDLPIAFDSAGSHVAAISFSLEYDATCLALDATDQNHDGLPDTIQIDAPDQFFPSITVNPGGQLGRIDVALADYVPPLAALRDTAALFTIQFRIVCPLAAGLVDYAYIRFAETPAVGFSDATGHDLPGVAREGFVLVIGGVPTPTPPATSTSPPSSSSPTPTFIPTAPSTPTPPAVVRLESLAVPDHLTRADRGVIFILDYAILTSTRNISLTIPVPENSYFDATASTLGWQCETAPVKKQCDFPLYLTAHPSSMSGRIFFAVALNWPLPAWITQIELTVTVGVNGVLSNQTQHVVLPMLETAATPQPDPLTLDLHPDTAELVAGLEQAITYTFTYTNLSQKVLPAVTFHLVLPAATKIRPLPGTSFPWICSPSETGQTDCALAASELTPAAQGQEQFVLEPPANLKVINVVVLIVYAAQEGQVLSSRSSVVPVRQPTVVEPEPILLFLPLIANPPAATDP